MTLTHYAGNTMRYVLDGAKLVSTGAYINSGATVTSTIVDGAGPALSTPVAPNFAYVAASNGQYAATVANTAVLTAGNQYKLNVTFTASSGDVAVLAIPIQCVARTE